MRRAYFIYTATNSIKHLTTLWKTNRVIDMHMNAMVTNTYKHRII